jgi:hypothetical protein
MTVLLKLSVFCFRFLLDWIGWTLYNELATVGQGISTNKIAKLNVCDLDMTSFFNHNFKEATWRKIPCWKIYKVIINLILVPFVFNSRYSGHLPESSSDQTPTVEIFRKQNRGKNNSYLHWIKMNLQWQAKLNWDFKPSRLRNLKSEDVLQRW